MFNHIALQLNSPDNKVIILEATRTFTALGTQCGQCIVGDCLT